jgi:hypothetical protein
MDHRRTHPQQTAAAKAGISERSARRIDRDPTLPSQRKKHPRGYRTRANPFEGNLGRRDKWPEHLKGQPGQGMKQFKVLAVQELRTFAIILARIMPLHVQTSKLPASARRAAILWPAMVIEAIQLQKRFPMPGRLTRGRSSALAMSTGRMPCAP